MNERRNVLKDKSFQYAVRVVNLYKYLKTEHKEFVIGKQILRSGTSVGANIREAQSAETKKDFIHKLGIAQKECDETLYWLELLKETNILTESMFNDMHNEGSEILKIIKSSILTTKQRM